MIRNEDVARAWANHEPAAAGNFYTDGVTIWSYGEHFPVGHHHPQLGTLLTTRGYSVTTTQHIREAWSAAVSRALRVDDVLAASDAAHRSNLAHLLVAARRGARQARRARLLDRSQWAIQEMYEQISTALEYRDRLGWAKEKYVLYETWKRGAHERADRAQDKRAQRRWLRENRPPLYRKYKDPAEAWAADPGSYDAYCAGQALEASYE